MTKADRVARLATRVALPRRDAEVVIDTLFDSIAQNVSTAPNPGVEIRGFGSFRVRQRRARQGRNPQSGAPVDVPAKRVPFFEPGKELKALVDGQPSGNGATFEKGTEHGSAGEGRPPAAPDPHDPAL
ncbi:MAG: HU family DNA-binding protein [Candidatus Methylomirabilales bacterium]